MAVRRFREDQEGGPRRPGTAGGARATSLWRRLGPGLITGAADDDPSGVGTYSTAGAQFGFGLLWLVPFCLPLMIAVQEMCGRVAAVTGKGLAAVISEHYPRWLLVGMVALLFAANVLNVWADLNAMAASARMLFGLPQWFWLTVMTAANIVLLILVPYRTCVKYLKWLTLALLAYIVTPLLPAMHIPWREVARSTLVPHLEGSPGFIMMIVGFVGTTISPYLFFWQASQTVEEDVSKGKGLRKQERVPTATEEELRTVRSDTVVGMLSSQTVAFFIVVCAAGTLHARGVKDIQTATDAASALQPLGGHLAYWLFALAIVGCGMLAVPTLAGSAAYAISETAGWRFGLYRRFNRAKGFYLTIAGVMLLGYGLSLTHTVSAVRGLFYSAVANGIAAPPLIVLLLLVCNNERIVGDRRNGIAANVLGWLTVVAMSAAIVVMFWAAASGKGM